MQTVGKEIAEVFGGRVRVRVCGICIRNERILMVRHQLYGADEPFWSTPGGGVQLGEPATNALVREMAEETGLKAEVGRLLFVNEHIQLPLHAIELFFEILEFQGDITRGNDPELAAGKQIIEDVAFLTLNEIKRLKPSQVHRLFTNLNSLQDIFEINKYIPAS
ncbi:NUDIX domain-containing protein [Dyadobacter sp.]|uniref:NUDIX domain-containing protein n=1 Tax=Dyadobacter sp. TaxID=1914288 RepID=UPI003F727E6B